MNRKQLIAAATIALIGTSAFAIDEQMVVPKGTLTRAEVQAEFLRSRTAGELVQNDSYDGVKERSFAARKGGAIEHAASRSRDEVRAEGRAAARSTTFNSDYVGG
ncbi:DUF4148 domain-containing protein [Piscinibacter sp.]|uniref:DUF4148 domain-containing protein n=1 Tax=Piscinibacter sp. TaxID=1903157 RepID=UPI0039E36CC4